MVGDRGGAVRSILAVHLIRSYTLPGRMERLRAAGPGLQL